MWQPVTGEDLGQQVWRTIDDIEHRLIEDLGSGSRTWNPTLAGGDLGPVLFFAYLGAVRPDGGASERATEILDRGIDALAEADVDPFLYTGFCGIGWTLEHLSQELFSGEDDLAAEVDAALRGLLANSQRKPFELMRGISGLGVYLTERAPRPEAVELLSLVLDNLEATAEDTPLGLTWHTTSEWLPHWKRATAPGGYYDLGLAHGIPGILGFLAAARRTGIDDSRVTLLAEGTVRWLLSQRLPGASDSAFPAFHIPGTAPSPTRLAWCYGDLGMAAVLLSAARAFDRSDWETEAIALARLAADRSEKSAAAVDACLCHGTAGNALIFLRLYHATDDPLLKKAALAWIDRTLRIRRPGAEMAGFPNWVPGATGEEGSWQPDAGFLMGISGIGLALLAAVSDVEPAWDRVMLLSIPPRVECASPIRAEPKGRSSS